MSKNFIRRQDVPAQLFGEDYARIRNPEGVFPAEDIIPMAKKLTSVNDVQAVVCDMDGTTTTTENLCIHSLEFMIRKISGKMESSEWAGLNSDRDYPNIIGNSTTRHVEYLIETYGDMIDPGHFRNAFIHSVLWFKAFSDDAGRLSDIRQNCAATNCAELLLEAEAGRPESIEMTKFFSEKYKESFSAKTKAKIVRCAVDIYYQRYHEILAAIDRKETIPHLERLLKVNPDSLIEPMPGIPFFLPLIKGKLSPDEAATLTEILIQDYIQKDGREPDMNRHDIETVFRRLAEKYRAKPAKLGLVTSSIFYEARIVIAQVFHASLRQIESWPLPESLKTELTDFFGDYRNVYDSFVTADDSSELRLKPHRDLYSIALYQMHVHPKDFDKVIGFEDSESGITAMRSAGIRLCCAVPFAETSGHDMSAASHILTGGVPEAVIRKLFIK